jgi:hypothetical protein
MTKRARNALIVLFAIVAVVFGVGWNPSAETKHQFSSVSDYKSERESGCTNSGSGCHGPESSYKDFNAYHPHTDCAKCHAHEGIACIPCHAPNNNHECPLCHDGSMQGAPDVVRITDNYPSGHYRETTHTAMGDDWDAEMRAQPDAEASAACSDCHSRDLRTAHSGVSAVAGSEYGSDIGCGECHNDVRAYGQAEVVANWKKRSCDACHKVGSSSPIHATDHAPRTVAEDSSGCASTGMGCHASNDLHALHPDKPVSCSGSAKKREPGCHKLGVEAFKPTAKSCGGKGRGSCHRAGADGTYVHKNAKNVHAPSNSVASSTIFDGLTCGDCHLMAPDGVSLLREHARSTSSRTRVPSDPCRNCHASPASADALADEWAARGSADACQACHGHAGLGGLHSTDVTGVHTVSGSGGCASTGPGCHPTSDISSTGEPTTTSGLHASCLRCHALSAGDGNGVYDPAKKTCGSGRDCHSSAKFNPATSSHKSAGGRDRKHTAGSKQSTASYVDLASGLSTSCGSCHQMRLGAEHKRVNASLSAAKNACTGCHNAEGSPAVVKGQWSGRTSDEACSACHSTSGAGGIHAGIGTAHEAVELGPDGKPAPKSCVRYGCHASLDLRRLHSRAGCAIPGCHTASGDIYGRDIKSCGGGNGFSACHTGFSAEEHFTNHDGNQSGDVHGITYGKGANSGCFGCHEGNLVAEHSRELASGSLTGAPANGCRVCHYDADDPGSGPLARVAKVRSAVDEHDLRCIACHASGTSESTDGAIASAHRKTSEATPLPAGKVWADPLDEWKAALDAPTGGGHNSLSAATVGADKDKRFPMTEFEIDGQSYVWALPPNSDTTRWLKADAFGLESIDTTEQITHLSVECSDCHTMPSDMAGPHGASVHVGIDPEYSQTAYSDPTRDESQFMATGDHRVVCMKCHNMQATTDPVSNPGGGTVHARHVQHAKRPSDDYRRWGEACIDCHVRIPHAWKRPRLLVRTVETTDGVAPDVYPYVGEDHDGLAGIVLRSYATSGDLRSRYCATNGCHGTHSETRHPLPSDIPTATFWP